LTIHPEKFTIEYYSQYLLRLAMSTIKIEDVSHVRFSVPDLKEMQVFLEEFGLSVATMSDTQLFMRGSGIAPFVHATELGETGFRALGLRAQSESDLKRFATTHGAEIELLDSPGGGLIVRLTDPDGYMIEVVAGQSPAKPLLSPTLPAVNTGLDKQRVRETVRIKPGPSQVLRLGHVVLEVSDFRASEAWYKERFGFITSDEIEVAAGRAIGAFMRCDRGSIPTDHHSVFLLQSPTMPKFNHAAFEVWDINDVMRGHDHLKSSGRTPAWGIGRHVLGSQVFDYWKDPWGHELEHWSDGDLFTAADPSNKAGIEDLLAVQWGPVHPLVAKSQEDQS
jgi:catechol 2,3-dioxygenase-like lactoylglutathione lyase family enzyme